MDGKQLKGYNLSSSPTIRLLSTFDHEDIKALKAYILNMDKSIEENFLDPNEFNVPPLTHSLHIQWPLINIGGKWHLIMENGACYQQA